MNLKREMAKILFRGISCGFGEDIMSIEDALKELETLCKDYAREMCFKQRKICSCVEISKKVFPKQLHGQMIIGSILGEPEIMLNIFNAPLPEELKEVEEANLIHKCGDCGMDLTLVRPGKYQCDNCE